jgi:ABC-type phosphate transport system auxiliary subunit
MNNIMNNIKSEIDKLSNINNIDDKIKKIEIIKSDINKNKNKLKENIEKIENIENNINININDMHINAMHINLDELKTKFYESNDINEKMHYYQLFANKINLLENELFD